jgi:LPS-assembly protein
MKKLILVLALILIYPRLGHTQDAPDRRFLFSGDKEKRETQRTRRQEFNARQNKIKKESTTKGFPFDLKAPTLTYDSNNRTFNGEGGMLIGFASSIIEADSGSVDVEHKTANLKGDVKISDFAGSVSASEASLKLDDGTGFLKNANIFFEDGDYKLAGETIEKLQGQNYKLTKADLTTCQCPESDDCPWRIYADEAVVERNGYGKAWGATVMAYDVPVFYTPYLLFPAKTERQSGLLAPTFGTGRRNGIDLIQPLYLVLSDSVDMTVTPVSQSKSRFGTGLEFREIFSERHTLEMSGLYVNESPRQVDSNGRPDNLGTITAGLKDPTYDINRVAGRLLYRYSSPKESSLPIQIIGDARHVNNDLFLREFNYAQQILDVPINQRFLTSRAILRAPVSEDFSFEARSEFNQDMVEDDDTVFQRAPELTLTGLHLFRPFGSNPLGARVVVSDQLSVTHFARDELFTGTRAEIYEKAKIPFHYVNYFDAEVGVDARASSYTMGNQQTLVSGLPKDTIDSSSTRVVPGIFGGWNTSFERVYDLEKDSFLATLAELGTLGRKGELSRVKHTLEPLLRYRYIPEVNQDDNPQFDSFDKLPPRNVVTYGFAQRLFGRYENRSDYLYGIEEATPNAQDLGLLRSTSPLNDSFNFGLANPTYQDFVLPSTGIRRELANLVIFQSYDIREDQRLTDLERTENKTTNPFSDVGINTTLRPNEYVAVSAGTNIHPETTDFSSYNMGTQLFDKRGDQLRLRINYVNGEEKPFRQLEFGTEVRITDRFQVAYYGRYNDIDDKSTAKKNEQGFLEQRGIFRFTSACKCWMLDFNASERLNPDDSSVGITLTMVGLGDIGNNFNLSNNQASNQTNN